MQVLDHGFIRLIETWGSGESGIAEAGIIEAARQSTQGSFRGWEKDRRLLAYLYNHKHSTPFEFAGAVIELRLPIFVARQLVRHRVFSINEASARYTELPELYYMPTVDRLMMTDPHNKQAGSIKGADTLDQTGALRYLKTLEAVYAAHSALAVNALARGVPKELARISGPVGQYTQMRVSTNLRGWLGFLTLRMDPHAQWEIRQYANTLCDLLSSEFPNTLSLFNCSKEKQ